MNEPDVVAIHEAGHAFCAVALGLALRAVRVGDDPRYELAGRPGPDQRLAKILTLMAGAEAEALFYGDAEGGATDDLQIADLLDIEDEIDLRRQVRDLIRLNASTVRRIVGELERAGELTGADVERLVRGTSNRDAHDV